MTNPAPVLSRCWWLLLISGLAFAQPAEEPRVLTTVAAIRDLDLSEADRHLPVRLRGVITYIETGTNLAYLQDETGGTYLPQHWRMVDGSDPALAKHQGAWVEVEARSSRGRFVPHPVGLDDGFIRVRHLGEKPMPPPIHPPRGGFPGHHLHNQWVQVDAFLVAIEESGGRFRLALVNGGKRLRVVVPKSHAAPPDVPLNSDVRVTGVFTADFNEAREMTGGNFFLQTFAQLEVRDPGLQQAFSQPARKIRELLRYRAASSERSRVVGRVTWSEAGRGFFLTDGADATWVETIGRVAVRAGEAVDVVGFPMLETTGAVLRDAVVRPLIRETVVVEPAPVPLSAAALRAGGHHGKLVRVEARVMDRLTLPHVRSLALNAGDVSFQARLMPPGPPGPLPQPGSWVAVTGVCEKLPGREDGLFQILLRDRGDLAVLRPPSWWTVKRIAWLAGGLGILGVAAVGWVIALRRRVAAQTALITEQVERQRVTEERARIGQELHDTLEQHLTGVAMQLEAATARVDPTAARPLRLATAMLQHSREEVRRSVWGLRSPLLEQEGLEAALRVLAAEMSTDRTRVTYQAEGDVPRLPVQTEFHLLRIAQEALANALKHAGPTEISLRLKREDTGVVLEIADNGAGLPADPAGRNGALHFGLLGMRERAARLGAKLEIGSQPGAGTRVHVAVPFPA